MTGTEYVAKRLGEELECRQMRQKDFAKLVGATEQTVSKWLSGKATPGIETLTKICEKFTEHDGIPFSFQDLMRDDALDNGANRCHPENNAIAFADKVASLVASEYVTNAEVNQTDGEIPQHYLAIGLRPDAKKEFVELLKAIVNYGNVYQTQEANREYYPVLTYNLINTNAEKWFKEMTGKEDKGND